MDRPHVSVILDNYNYAQYVGEAIESVLKQTYQDFEVIVVDDGSTDGSRAMIEAYAKKDIRIRPLLKENGGQMSAFNAAFAQTSGDIIALLDSDDYWYPKKLERIVEKHREYRFVQHYLSHNGKGIYRKVNTGVDWHRVLMEYGYLYNHSVCSALSFDRRLLAPLFPMTEEEKMRYCADGILVMAALSLTGVGMIEEELGFYRIHGNNGFAGRNDHGKAARETLHAQHQYVNRQLELKGFPTIPFSRHKYLRKLIGRLVEEGKLAQGDKAVVYGTESSGLYLTHVLMEYGIEIYQYADSAKEKQGQEFLGKPVCAPSALAKERDAYRAVIIASSAGDAISETLSGLCMQEGTDFYRLPI